MGNEAKYRSFLAACGCRNCGIDITVLLVISDLCGPHGLQFAHQLSGHQIVSLADGKYLTANGTACTLTAKAAGSSQNWNIESVQKDFEGYDLYYKITSVSTGAALTYYQGNNTIGLTAYTGDGAQKWSPW